jgi:cytochrome c553
MTRLTLWTCTRLLAAAAAVFAAATPALAAEAGDIAEGMRIYMEKGGCPSCHGWAGDGRKTDNQMPDGANLRETALTRDIIVLTIKCGRPGRSMPAYDRFAYGDDGRCYGMKLGDLKNNPLPDPPATLQVREVEMLTDFLFAKVIKQGAMDRAKCAAFWGKETEVCEEFKK